MKDKFQHILVSDKHLQGSTNIPNILVPLSGEYVIICWRRYDGQTHRGVVSCDDTDNTYGQIMVHCYSLLKNIISNRRQKIDITIDYLDNGFNIRQI